MRDIYIQIGDTIRTRVSLPLPIEIEYDGMGATIYVGKPFTGAIHCFDTHFNVPGRDND